MNFLLPVLSFITGGLAGIFFIYVKNSKRNQEFAIAKEKNEDLIEQIENQKKAIEALAQQNILNIELIATLKAKLSSSGEQNVEIKKQFTVEFENLANKIFTEKTKEFKTQSSENLSQLLAPLAKDINTFKAAFEDKIYKQSQEQISLKEEIKRITLANEKITNATEGLTKALKGDSKTQGDWGEAVLETILEMSGLVKDINFHTQQNIKDENGNNQRPDVVISLPDGKKIIIDSKVSLTSYEKYISSQDEIEKNQSISEFSISIKSHIKGLAKKDYQKLLDGNSLDFVIMFMPIDATFFLAMQSDNSIFNDALRQNVVITSPTTLIPIIRTISQMWKVDNQIKNVSEITSKAASLYDKLFIFVEKFEKVGNSITSSANVYNDAIKTLSSGKGNALRQAEELKKLGLPATKNIAEKKQSLDLIEKNIEEISATSIKEDDQEDDVKAGGLL